MTSWATVSWTIARAGGLTAYALLSLSVILGLALSVRWQSARWPRLITNDMHRFLTLLGLAFIVVHGLASWLDPFMRFGWSEILVPLTSHYRPIWMALGIVAGYLMLALWISSELRPRIGYTLWRRLHGLSFVAYMLATVHGIATGSDTRTIWGLTLYGGSLAAITALLSYRLLTPIGTRGRTYPNLAGATAILAALIVVWTLNGPAQPGWNVIANNGQGSGARIPVASAAQASTEFATAFTAAVQGTLVQNTDAATGRVAVQVDTTMTGASPGTFQVILSGVPAADGSVSVTGGQLTLTGSGGTPRYQGNLQDLNSNGTQLSLRAALAGTGTASLSVQAVLRIAPNGQVSGSLQATPA